MKLRFDESQITNNAKKYGVWSEEIKLMNLSSQIQRKGYLTKDQLTMVAKWKSPRSAGHVKKNTSEYVEDVTSYVFSTKNERSRIETLTILDGVSWPTASVLLHLFHTDPYPILDFRALWSVSVDVPKQYNYKFWQSYVEFCRDIARNNDITMRELDRALWQNSKDNQIT